MERVNAQIVLATFDRELWAAAQQTDLGVWPEDVL